MQWSWLDWHIQKFYLAEGCKDRQFLNGWEVGKNLVNSTLDNCGALIMVSSYHHVPIPKALSDNNILCQLLCHLIFGTNGTERNEGFNLIIRGFFTFWSRNHYQEKLRLKGSSTCWRGQCPELKGKAFNYW